MIPYKTDFQTILTWTAAKSKVPSLILNWTFCSFRWCIWLKHLVTVTYLYHLSKMSISFLRTHSLPCIIVLSSKSRNKYDEMGQIKSQKKSIRKTGTTVKVEKLFHRIPVRRNIFMKNDKKEIQKTYTTLMAYALMSQARFIVQSSVKKSQFQIWDHFFIYFLPSSVSCKKLRV